MSKVFTIAEISSNWEGEIDKGKALIRACKNANADAIKMQIWKAKELYLADNPIWHQFPDLEKYELTFEKAKELKEYADCIGIEWFCTPTKPEHVDLLERLDVKKYKIRSADYKNKELIEKVLKTGKDIFLSLPYGKRGFKSYPESFKLLYCIPEYPSAINRLCLKNLDYFDGYSNHYPSILPCLIAASRGAEIIETHVKFPDTISPDACCSITVEELMMLVKEVRKIEVML